MTLPCALIVFFKTKRVLTHSADINAKTYVGLLGLYMELQAQVDM